MPWRKYGTATAAGRAPTDTCRGRPPQAMDTGCTDAQPPRYSSLRNTLTTNTLQKAAFQTLKGYLYKTKGCLLQCKRLSFGNTMDTGIHAHAFICTNGMQTKIEKTMI